MMNSNPVGSFHCIFHVVTAGPDCSKVLAKSLMIRIDSGCDQTFKTLCGNIAVGNEAIGVKIMETVLNTFFMVHNFLTEGMNRTIQYLATCTGKIEDGLEQALGREGNQDREEAIYYPT